MIFFLKEDYSDIYLKIYLNVLPLATNAPMSINGLSVIIILSGAAIFVGYRANRHAKIQIVYTPQTPTQLKTDNPKTDRRKLIISASDFVFVVFYF